MAVPARTDARGRAALALLLAGLAAACWAYGALAALAQNGAAGSPPDSAALLAQAAPSGTASPSVLRRPAPIVSPDGAQMLEPGTGFTLRRVANPRYRAPIAAAGLIARPLGMLIGSEYARARITHRASGAVTQSTDWDLVGGRETGSRRRFELWAQGFSSNQYDQLRMLRLTSIQGPLEWSLGDVATKSVGTLPWIQRLRGGLLAHVLPHGSDWRVLGGVVPTYTHNVSPNSGLAGVLLDNLPMDKGALSFGVMGFGRRAPPPGSGGLIGSDTLAGGGGAALYAARVASRYGDVSTTFMAQVHTLDGAAGIAGLQAFDWTLNRPSVLASIRDQVVTRNARQPGTERLSPTPSHEARMSAQVRLPGGRAEMHLAGLTSSASDVDPGAQTVQGGVSGTIGKSGWYSGLDFSWNRRAPLLDDERRISAQAGCVSDRGNSVLMRLSRDADNLGRDQLQFTDDASFSLLPALRISLQPRLDWQERKLDRGMISARLGWPLFGSAARMNASVTLTSARSQDFHSELSEATVALSFAPRARDRAGLEARRYDESGVRSFEYTGSYDLQSNLYSNPAGALAAQPEGTLIVSVVRADSASGVPDVLVSLDGKEFRFTDGDGVARFTNTPPGSHVISVVERSLPASQRIVGAATAFITIERGRAPEPVRFEIARPVRRVRF